MLSAHDVFERAKQSVESIITNNPDVHYEIVRDSFIYTSTPSSGSPAISSGRGKGHLFYRGDYLVQIFVADHEHGEITVQIAFDYLDEDGENEDAAEFIQAELGSFLTFCRQHQVQVGFTLIPGGSRAVYRWITGRPPTIF